MGSVKEPYELQPSISNKSFGRNAVNYHNPAGLGVGAIIFIVIIVMAFLVCAYFGIRFVMKTTEDEEI